MSEGQKIESLIDEYTVRLTIDQSLQGGSKNDRQEILKERLASADWTLEGATELLRLADEYGAFMLRNALAIAVALGREDGSKGF